MAALGHANIATAIDLQTIAMAAGAVSGFTGARDEADKGLADKNPLADPARASLVTKLGSSAAGILSFLAAMFFTAGFSLAYLLPLMPFMRYFFAVLSWLAAVLEAVVAIPLVALGHLNPAGEGLPGQSAKNAYFFVFNIFLRPTLIVFGLVFGLMLFMLATSFLNFGYATAVDNASLGASWSVAAIGKIVYQILYIAILYVCANHSFQLIDHLPKHALTWMNAQGQAIPEMGNVDKIEGIGQGLTAYLGNQMMSQASAGAAAAGSAAGSLAGPRPGAGPTHSGPAGHLPLASPAGKAAPTPPAPPKP
jgi:conjugal transfer/type IV secretion protein DotA/TraY